MFKNLSPDWDHERDKRPVLRANTTVDKDYNPNGMAIKQPRASQEGQNALKQGKLQYKPDFPTEYAKSSNRQVRTRSQLILKAKSDKAKKDQEKKNAVQR